MLESVTKVGQRIRTLRGNIKQDELARSLGVNRTLISKWESGKTLMSVEILMKISDYFKVSTDYLLRGVQSQQIDIFFKTRLDGNAIDSIDNMAQLYPHAHIALESVLSTEDGIGLLVAIADFLQSPEESGQIMYKLEDKYTIRPGVQIDNESNGLRFSNEGIDLAKIMRYIKINEIVDRLKSLRSCSKK